jgi:mono/diheme cytochrome c family protein
MRIYAGLLTALFLVVFSPSLLCAQTNEQKPDAAAASNSQTDSAMPKPVKASPETIAQGKRIYGYDCAMCHGAEGDGKGDLATDMKLKLRDYRDASSLKDVTDTDLFNTISKGKGDMPKESDRAKPDEIWGLVYYIRTFAKKGATTTAAEAAPPPASAAKP